MFLNGLPTPFRRHSWEFGFGRNLGVKELGGLRIATTLRIMSRYESAREAIESATAAITTQINEAGAAPQQAAPALALLRAKRAELEQDTAGLSPTDDAGLLRVLALCGKPASFWHG